MGRPDRQRVHDAATSGELAPDKAPYKVELEGVLINAGVSLP